MNRDNYTGKVMSVFLTLLLVVSSVSVGMVGGVAAAGGYDADPSANQDVSDGGIYWQGADLTYNSGDDSDSTLPVGNDVTIYDKNEDAEDDFVANYVAEDDGDGDGEITFEASDEDFDTGSHYLEYENDSSGTTTVDFSIQEQTFSVGLEDEDDEDTTIQNEGPDAEDTQVDIEFDSNRGSYKVHVYDNDDNLEMDELDALFQENGSVETDSEGEDYYEISGSNANTYTLEFDEIETGTLDLQFEAIDSGASDNIEFDVVEQGDIEATFAGDNNLVEPRGDVAEFEVETQNTDTFTINFGELDSDGYEYSVDVDSGDEDTVELEFDSSKAGDETNPFSISDDTDDASFVSPSPDMKLDDPLVALGYEIELAVDGERTDLGSLNLTERGTQGLTTMVAPKDESLNDVSDIEEHAVETEQAALTEQVVLKLETTGLQHLFEDASPSDFDEGNSIYDKGVRLSMEQSEQQVNNSTGELSIGSSDAFLDTDEYDELEEGVYYFVFDASSISGIDEEDTYEASFEIQNQFEYYNDDDYDDDEVREEATDELTFYEEEVTLEENSDDFVEVPATEEAVISGTTTLAPGSEIQATLQSGSPHTLVETRTVEVSEDRTVEAQFDLESFEAGHEFNIGFGGINESQYDAVAVQPGVGSFDLDVTVEGPDGEPAPATVEVTADSLVQPEDSEDDSSSDSEDSDSTEDSSSSDGESTEDSSSDSESTDDSTEDSSSDSESEDSSSDSEDSESDTYEQDHTVEDSPITFEDLTEGEYTVTATPQDEELLEGSSTVTLDDDKEVTVTLSEPEPEPETYALTVEVLDESTGEPISGAEVSVGGQTSTTGEDGTATLDVEEGSYNVTASAEGYQSGSNSGSISSESSTTIQLSEQTSDDGSSDGGSDDGGSGGDGPLPGQPGFGAIISLVALLGAALLAARREQ